MINKKRGPKPGAKYKDTNPFEFGKILSRERRKKGLSQAELGNIMGTSKRVISHYEREVKNPSMEIIKNICEALSISPNIFIEPSITEEKEEQNISRKLKKKIEIINALSPKSQKALRDYIDILAKAEEVKVL